MSHSATELQPIIIEKDTCRLIYIHMLCRHEAFSLVDLGYVPLRRIFIG